MTSLNLTMNIEQQLANNASTLSEDFALFSEHITCVCFCLLKACSTTNFTSSFAEFNDHVLGNRSMETFCLDLLYFMDQDNTTQLFDSCLNPCVTPHDSSIESYPLTGAPMTTKSIEMERPLMVYSFFNIFIIALYSLTIFVSIFGKYYFDIFSANFIYADGFCLQTFLKRKSIFYIIFFQVCMSLL